MASPSSLQRELVALVDYPREDLSTEIKRWLDLKDKLERANVARELIALANQGGGHLLFGFTETSSGWSADPNCPADLSCYSADELNNILKAHAEPIFECHAHHVESTAGTTHVVVRVPGGHLVPIRARGGPSGSKLTDHCYYVRRPGPESAPPETGHEWGELLTRCVDNNHERQVESFRRILRVIAATPDLAEAVSEVLNKPGPLAQWSDASRARLRDLEKSS